MTGAVQAATSGRSSVNSIIRLILMSQFILLAWFIPRFIQPLTPEPRN